jgi:hypothetical protein
VTPSGTDGFSAPPNFIPVGKKRGTKFPAASAAKSLRDSYIFIKYDNLFIIPSAVSKLYPKYLMNKQK